MHFDTKNGDKLYISASVKYSEHHFILTKTKNMNKSFKTYLACGLVASLFVPVTALADTAIPTSMPAEVQQAKSTKVM